MTTLSSPASVSASYLPRRLHDKPLSLPSMFSGAPADAPCGITSATLAATLTDALADSFGGMLRWFAHGSAYDVLPMQRTSLRQTQSARKLGAADARPAALQSQTGAHGLRVLQLKEAGQTRSSVGRMVISGRMADVCAELDRLVAREAALH